MNGLTFKYVPKDVFGKMVRELTLGLYPTNTTISDGTILGNVSTDIYGNECFATEYQNYYQFNNIIAGKYKLIKSGPGVLTEILEDAYDVPFSGRVTGSDIPYADNSNVSVATKINQLENTVGALELTYAAAMNQSGSNHPVATELRNMVGEIVWTRLSAGIYTANCIGAFTSGLVIPPYLMNLVDIAGVAYRLTKTSTDILTLTTVDFGVPTDGLLTNFPIEFKIYI